MNADPYVVSYFVVLRRGSTDEALLASSALLLTAGLFILLVAILGCCGAIKRNRTMLSWVRRLYEGDRSRGGGAVVGTPRQSLNPLLMQLQYLGVQ